MYSFFSFKRLISYLEGFLLELFIVHVLCLLKYITCQKHFGRSTSCETVQFLQKCFVYEYLKCLYSQYIHVYRRLYGPFRLIPMHLSNMNLKANGES